MADAAGDIFEFRQKRETESTRQSNDLHLCPRIGIRLVRIIDAVDRLVLAQGFDPAYQFVRERDYAIHILWNARIDAHTDTERDRPVMFGHGRVQLLPQFPDRLQHFEFARLRVDQREFISRTLDFSTRPTVWSTRSPSR